MRKYYHKTIVLKDIFANNFIYILTVILIMSSVLAVMIRFEIRPSERYVIHSLKGILAIEDETVFPEVSIYDIFSDIVPLVKSSDEMMKKYKAYYGGVKKQMSTKEETGFLQGRKTEETDMSKEGIVFNNATAYPVYLNEIKQRELEFSNPAVLIVHTHTSEAYAENADARTTDKNKNVIRIGAIIKEKLLKEGIYVIHDTTQNDYPAYNGSYNKALGVIQKNLENNPDIQVVLDIHRDYTAKNNNGEEVQLRPVGNVNGEKCAQMMLVVGTDYNGLKHPDWRHNLSFAVKINERLDEISESIARPINIRKERFNQHLTPGSLIIEVGSASNYLSESERTAEYIGEAIAEVLKEYRDKK